MASNMLEHKMFASTEKNPWWSIEGENFIYPNATNEELLFASKADFPVKLICLSDLNDKFGDYYILINERTGEPLRMSKGRFVPYQVEDFAKQIFQLGQCTEIGAIGQGEKVFFSIKQQSYTIGEGNTHQTYINIVLPHDGTMKITFGLGNFRIECANTFNAWKSTLNDQNSFSTKQTKVAPERVNIYVREFLKMQEQNESLQNIFQELAKRSFTLEKQGEIITQIFGGKESTRSKNQQEKLAQIIGDNASKINGLANTGYALFNGVTFYTSHEQILKGNTERNESLLFGSSMKFAENALNVIMNAKPDNYEETSFQRAIAI